MIKKLVLFLMITFIFASTVQAEDNVNPATEKYQKQIASYDDKIKSHNKDSNLYFKRAEVEMYKIDEDISHLSNAYKDYSKAIKLNKKFTNAYFKRAQLYNYGEYVELFRDAYEDLGKVIKLEPKNPNYKEAYAQRAQLCYAEYSDITLASMLIENSSSTEMLSELLAQAINDYTKAIEFDSNNWQYYFKRGKVYSAKNEYESAIEDYSKAIELNKSEIVIYLERGQLYEKIKSFDKALEDYKIVAESENAVTFVKNAAQEGIERISNAAKSKETTETKE